MTHFHRLFVNSSISPIKVYTSSTLPTVPLHSLHDNPHRFLSERLYHCRLLSGLIVLCPLAHVFTLFQCGYRPYRLRFRDSVLHRTNSLCSSTHTYPYSGLTPVTGSVRLGMSRGALPTRERGPVVFSGGLPRSSP